MKDCVNAALLGMLKVWSILYSTVPLTRRVNKSLHVFLLWLMVVWSKFSIILTPGNYARCWRLHFIPNKKQMRIKPKNRCNNSLVLVLSQTIVQLWTFSFIEWLFLSYQLGGSLMIQPSQGCNDSMNDWLTIVYFSIVRIWLQPRARGKHSSIL